MPAAHWAGAPYPQIDLGNRQTRLPISRVKIRKTAQCTFEVNSIGLRDWPKRIFIFHGQKDTDIFCTCIRRYVRVTVPQSLQELVRKNANHVPYTYIRAHHVRVIYDDTCTRISHLIYVFNSTVVFSETTCNASGIVYLFIDLFLLLTEQLLNY